MEMHDLLFAAVALLAVTALAISFFHRIGLGSILGFLAAGVILGPSVSAVTTEVDALREISELGVVLLLFVIGLEMQPRKLWSMRRLVFGFGSLQVLVTGLLIAGFLAWLGLEWQASVIIGLGLALSSTAFVLKMLAERGDMTSDHGKATFSVLLLQDLAIVPLLALVPFLAGGEPSAPSVPLWQKLATIVGLFGGLFVTGRYLVPMALTYLAKQRNIEAFNIVVGLAVLGAAWAMEVIGASEALGTFLMGMLLSAGAYRHQIEAAVEPFKGLLLGLFFVSVGMSIDFGVLGEQGFSLAADILVVLIIKTLVLLALGILFGLGRGTAIRTAFLLPQSGEFGFVLFGAAAAAGLLTNAQFAELIAFVSVTMLLTPLLAKLGDWLALRADPPAKVEAGEFAVQESLDRHVVVAGYGRVGRVVSIMLDRAQIPYVALDSDPKRVALGKSEGREVYYGDLTDDRVLRAAGLGRAAAVAITVNDMNATKRLTEALREFHPDLSIYARTRDIETRNDLLACGVSQAVPEAAEASLQLGSKLLFDLGVAEDDLTLVLGEMRGEGYQMLRIQPRAL